MKAEYDKCRLNRRTEENDWYLQLAFYNGQQYHSWATINGRQGLSEEPNPSGLPRITVNRIEPIVRTEVAKTTSGQPSASVVPASNDDDDLLAATAAEQVWQAVYDKNNFQTQILQKAEFWRAITGNGFIKAMWDSSIEIKTPRAEVDELLRTPERREVEPPKKRLNTNLYIRNSITTAPTPQIHKGKVRVKNVYFFVSIEPLWVSATC
jgi:hypothetical protein